MPLLTPHEALIYLMVITSASDRDMTDVELARIGDVVRSWPHGISLKVTERTPVLLIEKGAKFVEVDDEGVRFATVSDAPKNVPTLELAVARPESLRRFPTSRLVREAVRPSRANRVVMSSLRSTTNSSTCPAEQNLQSCRRTRQCCPKTRCRRTASR